MKKSISISVNLDNENNKLQKEIEAHLAELRIILRSNIDVNTGAGFSNYYIDKYTKEDLKKSQIRKCFKGMVSSLQVYIDRLISIVDLANNPIKVTRELKNDNDKVLFIAEKREEILKSISSNSKFKISDKLLYFFPQGDNDNTRGYIQSHFSLRNALEHKDSVSEKEIVLKYQGRPKIIIDNKEISAGCTVKAGQLLEIQIPEITKTFNKNEEIILSQEEIEDIGFTFMTKIVNFFIIAFNKKLSSSKPS